MRSASFRNYLAAISLGLAPYVAAAQVVENPPPQVATASPGYFGALIVDAPNGDGALLREVLAASPAESAGLRAGDVITQAADTPIRIAQELIAALQTHGPGERVRLAVTQAGFRNTVEVTLGERPAPERRQYADFGRVAVPRQHSYWRYNRSDTLLADNTPLDERLGLRTVAATQAALARRGLPDRPGALVMRVERDSAADLAGIPMSSLIVNADGKEITSPQSLAIALSSAEGDVELTYCIGGEERTCRVQIGK